MFLNNTHLFRCTKQLQAIVRRTSAKKNEITFISAFQRFKGSCRCFEKKKNMIKTCVWYVPQHFVLNVKRSCEYNLFRFVRPLYTLEQTYIIRKLLYGFTHVAQMKRSSFLPKVSDSLTLTNKCGDEVGYVLGWFAREWILHCSKGSGTMVIAIGSAAKF